MAQVTAAGRRLRIWRKQNKYSQFKLAVAIGYTTHDAIAKFETGQRALPVVKLCLLEEITGISAEQLAGAEQAEEIAIIRGT